jgi:ornithine decarboxylase
MRNGRSSFVSRLDLPVRRSPGVPSEKLAHFLGCQRIETPYLIVDLDVIAERFRTMRYLLPHAAIHYSVKANPERKVLARDIAYAYQVGVRMFSFDSFSELKKLADFAPGSRVCCRLLINSRGAEWPLSRKFGCDREMACDLLRQSRRLGLVPRGVIFHVGSQQSDPHQWVAPIKVAAEIFLKLTREGIDLRLLNLGGGFPARYRSAVPDHSVYALAIAKALRRYFGGAEPRWSCSNQADRSLRTPASFSPRLF